VSTTIQRLGVLITAVLVAALLPLVGGAASGSPRAASAPAGPPELLTAAPAGAARAATLPTPRTSVRARLVGFDARALPGTTGRRVAISFFPDARFVAEVQHRQVTNLATTWTGQVVDDPLSTFVAVRVHDTFRASVISPKGTFTIERASVASPVYRSSEYRAPRETGDDQRSAADVARMDRVTARSVAKPTPRGVTTRDERTLSSVDARTPRRVTQVGARRDSRRQLDIGIVFSPQAVALFGSPDAAAAAGAYAVALNNQIYANSGITTSWRLVGTRVGVNEIGNFEGDLKKVSKGKGAYRTIKRWRKQIHADAVNTIIAGNGSLCGIAWINTTDSKKYYWLRPYSVVGADCIDNLSVSHEVGHNYGASHDPYALKQCTSCGGTAFKYGRGFVDVPGGWYTVMAYASQCYDQGVSCTRVGVFSSPNVAYGGVTAGNRTQNNARVLNKTAKRMARFNLSRIYPAKVKLKGKPKHGKKVHIVSKRKKWNPTPRKLRYRWVVNGSYVTGKKGKRPYLKLKKAWKGMTVYGIVIGKKKTYTPVSVATKVKVVR
jgi:hypothetical protein